MNPYANDNDDVSDDEIDELTKRDVTIENGDVLKDGRGNEYTVMIDNSHNIEIRLIDDLSDSSEGKSDTGSGSVPQTHDDHDDGGE